MKEITILTEPISVNRLYRGRRFLTREGSDAKERMAWEAKIQWGKKVLECPVMVSIVFHYRNPRRDRDGALKGLLDCLQGVIWKNDSQIVELHAWKMVDRSNPRIEMRIEELSTPS